MPSAAYERYASTQALSANADLETSIRYFRAHIERHLPADIYAKVLDLGCGYGKNLLALQRLGYWNSFGIDLSEEQIKHSRSLGLKNVSCADACEWLFRRYEEFDVILIADVLEHLSLDDLLELGKLIRQSLKSEGKLIVQVPNGIAPMSPYVFGDLTHHRAFTVQSLQQLFLLSGLTPVGYYEVPTVRPWVWKFLFHPLLSLCHRVLYGSFQDVFTANILAVAQKA